MGVTDLRCFTLDILPLLYKQVFVHRKLSHKLDDLVLTMVSKRT